MYHHIKRHAKTFAAHMKANHAKYLFSAIWWGLFLKLAIFVLTGLGISISLSTHADVQTGCYTTGQYLTWGYLTWGYLTGQYLTWEYYTGWYITWWYYTGWYITWWYYTGWYITWWYITGCYLTGEYLTWWYQSGDERTGEYLTGGYETGCYSTGEYFTGEYFTGQYLTGQYLTWGYITGQYLTGQYLTWGYITGEYLTGQFLTWGYITWCVTIDTTKPSITGITVTLNGVLNSYIGLNGIAKISFTADEELTGNVITFRWVTSTLLSKSGLQYTYQQTLSNTNTEWLLNFSIAYNDLVGNTGFYAATWPVTFDKTAPTITGFVISGNDQSGFTLTRQTNEATKYNLNYTITGLSGGMYTGTTYGTSFNYLITGVTIGKTCDFQLNISDLIGNSTVFSGKIEVWTNGVVSFNYGAASSTLASMNTWTTYVAAWTWAASATGNLASFALTLQNEINKFNSCRNSVSYRNIDLTIQGNDFTLRMPQFEKDAVKTLVQAFTIFMVSTLKSDTHLTADNFNLLTRKFNNILIILKLVRDDDNECKQNLSNYHIMQFQKTMAEFGINL